MVDEKDRFLLKRNGRWHYNRRVPNQYLDIESRRFLRTSLKTKSIDIARMRRDALEEADNAYWYALSLESLSSNGVTETMRDVAKQRHKAASARALVHGFTYKPIQALLEDESVEDILARLKTLEKGASIDDTPQRRDAEALMGTASRPDAFSVRVSDAFKLYVDTIAFDSQFKKSPHQRRSWEKAKRTSINYFIQAASDLKMDSITRDIALEYRNWWIDRIKTGDEDGKKPTPYTANRHVGNMRTLYRSFFEYRGEEDRPNPFRKLSFKEDRKSKKKRPPFETKWIVERILAPGVFDDINPQARHILLTLIETGARPSEICNLRPENIRLKGNVPYIAIREKEHREIKADASDRDIPLMGISLAAMQANPKGFPRYFDKETSLSAILMKALKSRDLLPTENHKVYSIRHSFEKRMLEAGLDYGLRCKLMGHKNDRPEYGDGGSLEYRRDEMLKILLPYSNGVL